MRKIPTVYVRDDADRSQVTDAVTPGCEWVLAGEGTPTRKYDGTCVLYDGDRWWARREVKAGKDAPAAFIEVEHDPVTGKTVGWEPIEQSAFAKFHAEAVVGDEVIGTYELVGPRINGNHDQYDKHTLVPHAQAMTPDQLYDASVGSDTPPKLLVGFVWRKYGWEGCVWHHPDGRMAKLKARDLRVGHRPSSLAPARITHRIRRQSTAENPSSLRPEGPPMPPRPNLTDDILARHLNDRPGLLNAWRTDPHTRGIGNVAKDILRLTEMAMRDAEIPEETIRAVIRCIVYGVSPMQADVDARQDLLDRMVRMAERGGLRVDSDLR